MASNREEFEYQEEGVINQTISSVIALFVGLGVVILVIILVSILGGKAYTTVQSDLTSATVYQGDTNDTLELIQGDVNSAIHNAFSAYGDSVAFIGIIVLALVFFLVLALLATGMRPFAGGGTGAI